MQQDENSLDKVPAGDRKSSTIRFDADLKRDLDRYVFERKMAGEAYSLDRAIHDACRQFLRGNTGTEGNESKGFPLEQIESKIKLSPEEQSVVDRVLEVMRSPNERDWEVLRGMIDVLARDVDARRKRTGRKRPPR